MADLAITAANVLQGSSPQVESGYAGETILAGKSVYKAANGLFMLAQSDGTPIQAGLGVRFGVAQGDSRNGQPIFVQYGGQLGIGGTVVVGTVYCISDTFGGICTLAAVPSGNLITILGFGISATTIDMNYAKYTGITQP